MEKRTPDWLLERLALGELPVNQHRDLLERLDQDPRARQALDALEASNQEILNRYPPAKMGSEIRARLLPEAGIQGVGRRTLRFGALGMASVAAIAAASLLIFLPPSDLEPTDEIRLKGLEPALQVHRSRAGGVERLEGGAKAFAGDVIQLSYVPAGQTHGVILSIDGGGEITLHLPEEGSTAAPLSAQGATSLPYAYELDLAPGFERFFFITADEPFSVETVLSAVEALAETSNLMEASDLLLPPGLHQTSLLLRK